MTAEDYLRRVSFALRDLPWKTRHGLVSELRGHLSELPAETDLGARLGAPEEYATDLRSAAGLERRRGAIAFLRARRPRNVILIAVLLTAIGLAIGSVAWIQSYQPLAFAGSMADPAGAEEAQAGDSESVVFHEGRPFRFGISVRNTGSFTVRVLGVRYPPSLPFSARLVISGPDYHEGTAGPYLRFRPFELRPGEERLLLLKGVYAHCSAWGQRTSVGLETFPVRFSFLWKTSTADIPLPETLAIVFAKNCAAGDQAVAGR